MTGRLLLNLLLILLVSSSAMAQTDTEITTKVTTWAAAENLRDFPSWLKRYPNFVPQAGMKEPVAVQIDNPVLEQQYRKSLTPVFTLFNVQPRIILLADPGLSIYVIGREKVCLSQGFRKTDPAALRALLLQEYTLASLRQALALAKPKQAYELKMRAYFIAAIGSLSLDKSPDSLTAALDLRYKVDLQLSVPNAREGVSQAARKEITKAAMDYWASDPGTPHQSKNEVNYGTN